MAKLTLSGLDDLDDSLPRQTIVETQLRAGRPDIRGRVEEIDTSNFGVPVARSLMIQPVKCQACAEEHYEHQGICLELHYTDGTKMWRKMELLEAAAYRHLPRNVQYAHMMAIDFCHSCYLIDQMVDRFFKPQLDVTGLDEEVQCDTTKSLSFGPTIQSSEESTAPTGKEECLSARPDPWSRSLPVLVPGQTVTFAG